MPPNQDPPDATQAAAVTALQPPGWPAPKGYANGILAEGRMVFTGGMVGGWDEQGHFADGFIAQTRQTLGNIVAVLAEAGAGPQHLTRLTWYVLGYRRIPGRPARAGRGVSRGHRPPLPGDGGGTGGTAGGTRSTAGNRSHRRFARC